MPVYRRDPHKLNYSKDYVVFPFELWDYQDAPGDVKQVVPPSHAGGWVAFIPSACASDLTQVLLAFLTSTGATFVCCETGDDCTVLAGPYTSVSS